MKFLKEWNGMGTPNEIFQGGTEGNWNALSRNAGTLRSSFFIYKKIILKIYFSSYITSRHIKEIPEKGCSL